MEQNLPFPGTSPTNAGHGGHSCGCHVKETAIAELDARTIPPAVRHAAVFGALEAIQSGFSMILVAPHNPLPLLAQAEQRFGGAFTTEYVEEGPEVWKVKFTRK